MSRIGKLPVEVPSGVTVTVGKEEVSVKGPKGVLSERMQPGILIGQADGMLSVTRENDQAQTRASHGLMRSLVANMVHGVSKEFERKLTLIGVGYRAKTEGKNLVLNVGYSNPVEMAIPKGMTVECSKKGDSVTITGASKQRLGEFCAQVRRIRPPEPYKGKGIRYHDERVKTKVGKKVGA